MLDIGRPADSSARSRALGATWASASLHVALAVLIGAVWREKAATQRGHADRQQPPLVVWLDRPGQIGGGGAGGNHSVKPPQHAERRGSDRLTVPAARPVSLVPVVADQPP